MSILKDFIGKVLDGTRKADLFSLLDDIGSKQNLGLLELGSFHDSIDADIILNDGLDTLIQIKF
jgi:hypothetical protein